MTTYVALLRGINVGGRSLPMKNLKAILADLGCDNVQTYIQSGNVVLESDADSAELAPQISNRINEAHGFEPRLMILTRAAFEEAAAHNPFPAADDFPKTVHLGFLESEPPQPDLAGLDAVRKDSERFALRERVYYLHTPDGFGRSKLAERSERLLGVPMTMRNWRTVGKLLAMLDTT